MNLGTTQDIEETSVPTTSNKTTSATLLTAATAQGDTSSSQVFTALITLTAMFTLFSGVILLERFGILKMLKNKSWRWANRSKHGDDRMLARPRFRPQGDRDDKGDEKRNTYASVGDMPQYEELEAIQTEAKSLRESSSSLHAVRYVRNPTLERSESAALNSTHMVSSDRCTDCDTNESPTKLQKLALDRASSALKATCGSTEPAIHSIANDDDKIVQSNPTAVYAELMTDVELSDLNAMSIQTDDSDRGVSSSGGMPPPDLNQVCLGGQHDGQDLEVKESDVTSSTMECSEPQARGEQQDQEMTADSQLKSKLRDDVAESVQMQSNAQSAMRNSTPPLNETAHGNTNPSHALNYASSGHSNPPILPDDGPRKAVRRSVSFTAQTVSRDGYLVPKDLLKGTGVRFIKPGAVPDSSSLDWGCRTANALRKTEKSG